MKKTLTLLFAAILVAAQLGFAQEAEPNDSLELATDLGTVGTQTPVLSSQASLQLPGDIDWFEFALEEPMDLVVYSDSGEDLRLVIYDEDADYIDHGMGYVLLTQENGTYFVRVDSCDLETDDYTLILSSLTEAEPNDCITDADDLGLITEPLIVGGSIEPIADIDFFRFEVPAGSEGYVTIATTVSDHLDGDYDYSDEGYDLFEWDEWTSILQVLYSYNESEDRYIPIEYDDYQITTYLTAGTYAIRLEDYGSPDAVASYVLSIGLFEFECEPEPNDLFDEALDLGVLTKGDTLTQDACIIPEDDVDYYIFDLNETMNVAIELSGDSSGDSYLCLYDEEQDEIECDDDDGEDYWSRIDLELEAGTYYLEVEEFANEDEFLYTLTVEGT